MIWLFAILVAVSLIITYQLSKYLKAKTAEVKLNTLDHLGNLVVSVIEQMDDTIQKFRDKDYTISMINPSKDMQNLASVDAANKAVAKKALAVTMLKELATRSGIKTTPAVCSAVIEAKLNDRR